MSPQRLQTLIILLALIIIDTGLASLNSLKKTISSNCLCPGYEQPLSYECSIAGEPGVGSTIWRGSAIQCPESGNEIVLRHRSFTGGVRSCDGGSVAAQGIRVEDNSCYTSQLQLNVTVDSSLDNKTIECIYNNGTTTAVIGTSTIEIITDSYPPPNDIKIIELDIIYDHSINVTFKWSPAVFNCPSLYYIISSNDCGFCPNTTAKTTATCSGLLAIAGENCTFGVKTGVCDNMLGNASVIQLTLTAPGAPVVKVIPWYSYETNQLSMIITLFNTYNTTNYSTFNEAVAFNAPIVNYTVEYIDTISGKVCQTADIDIQHSCNEEEVCKHEYNLSLSSSHHEADIIVSASATNLLGNGSPINITVGFINTFVMVSFLPKYTSVSCKFLDIPQTDYNLHCSIAYGSYNQWNSTSVSDTVVVAINTTQLDQFLSSNRHFNVTATNGTFTAYIEGMLTFNIIDQDTENTNKSMFVIVISTVILTGTVISFLGLVLLFILKNQLKTCHISEMQTDNSDIHSDSQQTGRYMVHEQLGIYSLLEPTAENESPGSTNQMQGVYADINICATKENMALYPMSDDRVQYAELNYHEVNNPVTTQKVYESDKLVNLDNLLIQLRDEITPHWQKFGLIVGVPQEIIAKYSEYPPDQCIIEILDYWLRHHNDGPLTWRDVAYALRKIKLCQLAEKILKVYVTGHLPVQIDVDVVHGMELHVAESEPYPPQLPPKPSNGQGASKDM